MKLDKQQTQLLDKAETQTHALLDTLAALSDRQIATNAMRGHKINLWAVIRTIDDVKSPDEKGGA